MNRATMRDQTDSRTLPLPLFPVGDYTPGVRQSRGYEVLMARYRRDTAPSVRTRNAWDRELREVARVCIGAGVA